MAIGKGSKSSAKGGKRGNKKAIKEPMSRKEWYDVCAPATFKTRQFTKTIANKTVGQKLGAANLLGRVFEANFADLDGATDKDQPYRKVKLQALDVKGRNVLTQFHSMSLTTDKLRSMFRKWCTTIETPIICSTADGYQLRINVIAFTARQKNQLSKNCYAPTRLEKWVRLRMAKMTAKRLGKSNIDQTVTLLTQGILSDSLYKRCNPIVPLRDVKINFVKVLKTPSFDGAKLLDSHGVLPVSIEDQARVIAPAAEAAAAEAPKA